MPISGNLFAIFLLLSMFLPIITLSGYVNIETASAVPKGLHDSSNDRSSADVITRTSSIGSGGGSNVYENPDYMIRMTYPSNWRESPHPEDLEGLLVQLKPQGRQDVYFAISVFGAEGKTQQDLNEENLRLLRQDYEILGSGTINMASDNAFFIEFMNHQEETTATVVSVLKNENEYYVEFGGAPQAYSRYLQVAEEMVSSIEIGEYGDVGGEFRS